MSDLSAPNPDTTLFAAMMAAADSYSVSGGLDPLCEGDALPENGLPAGHEFSCF